jgi:hypothetical protein
LIFSLSFFFHFHYFSFQLRIYFDRLPIASFYSDIFSFISFFEFFSFYFICRFFAFLSLSPFLSIRRFGCSLFRYWLSRFSPLRFDAIFFLSSFIFHFAASLMPLPLPLSAIIFTLISAVLPPQPFAILHVRPDTPPQPLQITRGIDDGASCSFGEGSCHAFASIFTTSPPRDAAFAAGASWPPRAAGWATHAANAGQ